MAEFSHRAALRALAEYVQQTFPEETPERDELQTALAHVLLFYTSTNSQTRSRHMWQLLGVILGADPSTAPGPFLDALYAKLKAHRVSGVRTPPPTAYKK